MQLEDVLRAAVERARGFGSGRVFGRLGDDVLAQLRDDAHRLFSEVEEPPLYRRAEDPARKQAEAQVPRAEELLGRAWAFAAQRPGDEGVKVLAEALRAHLATLVHIVNGQLTEAEVSWREARAHEQRALGARRLWARSDEGGLTRPVFDRQSGSSRYDPRSDSVITVKLPCPSPACRQANVYKFSSHEATQPFTCESCRAPFSAYFAEVDALELSDTPAGRRRRYRFEVEELAGGRARVELEDPHGTPFPIARRDLLAFLYGGDHKLAGLLNLSTGQLLWLGKTGCFVATAAFGEDAPELREFRAFRDEVLMRTGAGRLLIRGYYAWGPALAREVGRRGWLRGATRRMLGVVHRWLLQRERR